MYMKERINLMKISNKHILIAHAISGCDTVSPLYRLSEEKGCFKSKKTMIEVG